MHLFSRIPAHSLERDGVYLIGATLEECFPRIGFGARPDQTVAGRVGGAEVVVVEQGWVRERHLGETGKGTDSCC